MSAESARVYPAREVSKPWGSELVFAELDGVLRLADRRRAARGPVRPLRDLRAVTVG